MRPRSPQVSLRLEYAEGLDIFVDLLFAVDVQQPTEPRPRAKKALLPVSVAVACVAVAVSLTRVWWRWCPP